MEKLRLQIDRYAYHKLQPLGCPEPGKGMVSEDLGRTEFKTSSTTNGRKPSRRPHANPSDNDESDNNTTNQEDLDVHSSSPTSPSRDYKESKVSKKSLSLAEFHVTPFRSRSKPKPRPNFRSLEPPDTKEENETNTSLQKPLYVPYSKLASNSMPPSNQLVLQRPQKSRSRENGQATFPLVDLNPNQTKRPKKSKGKREPEPFPMQDDCQATKSELKSRSPNQIRHDPAPFPMEITSPSSSLCKYPQTSLSAMSSVRDQVPRSKENSTRVLQRFPLDSSSTLPLYCTLSNEHDEDDELALTDNDTNAILAYGGPRPFPMAISQCLQESIHQVSGSKRSAKNSKEQRGSKRSRPSPGPNTFDISSSLSIEGDSHVDPALLCPYCDEPWPSSPSPTLLSLLECTKRKSYTDPRPGNVLGLKAPLAAFVELCQRHRFEMTHLPLALERGWPTRLDFASLPNRIRSFENQLGRVIGHSNESQFWREVKDDMKEVGRMKIVSVSGQYATFERTLPGYYGEQGSIIIHQTLYSLFPPDDIPPASVDPLTPDQFLTQVLVPETAVLLIQDDMGLPTKEEALRVLGESKKYGVAMFPEQAQGEEAAEVGEQLAKERAKERRKLLEARGEADADVQRQVEQEHRLAKKVKGKDKDEPAAKGNSGTKESDSDADPILDEEKRPRVGVRKAKLASASAESIVNARPMRLNDNGSVSTLDGPTQLTLGPLKKQTREPSIIPGRSKCSPSTFPDMCPPKPASRSSPNRKAISSLPRPLTQENRQDSRWIFDLRNVSPSPNHEDEDVDFNEISAHPAGNPKAREPANSDLDVVIMEDESAPKPRAKLMKRRVLERTIVNDSSDSKATTQRATPKLKAPPNQKAEEKRNQAVGVALGQTKRKKKGITRDKLAISRGSAHT